MSANFNPKQNERLQKKIETIGREAFLDQLNRACLHRKKTPDAIRKLKAKLGQQAAFTLNQDNFECLAAAFSVPERMLAEELDLHLTHVPDEDNTPIGRLRTKSRDRLLSIVSGHGYAKTREAMEKVSFDQLPDELHLAIGSFYRLAEMSAVLEVPVWPNNGEVVYVMHAKDSHEGLELPQEEIEKAFGLFCRTESVECDDFGVKVSPELSLYLQQAFAFPFTLNRPRRAFFGALPFAKQTTIGFIMHRDHPAYKEFSRATTSLPPLKPIPLEGASLWKMEATSLEWMADMIKATRLQGGKIFSFVGDVQFSFLMNALHKNGAHVKALTDLGDIQDKLARHENNIVDFFNTKASVNDVFKAKASVNDVFIFDPWESSRLKGLNPDFRAILCPHGVPVTVGVGFALNLLPRLLIGQNWRKVWNAAYSFYREAHNKLEDIGIQMLTAEELKKMGMPAPPPMPK